MNDHVSRDTAIRLSDAGFPIPEFKAGQFWWGIRFPAGTARKEVLCVVLERQTSSSSYSHVLSPVDGLEQASFGTHVFAPTATDILKELPGHIIHYKAKDSTWVVWSYEPDDLMFSHESPAEAAALAYLTQKGKK